MRTIKVLLIALLVVTAALFGATEVYSRVSGREEPPRITCAQEVLEVSVEDDDTALLAGVTAWDDQDGDLTGQILVAGVSKLIGGDTAKVTYLVFDSHDNMASAVGLIRYRDYRRPTFIVDRPLDFSSTSSARLLDEVRAEDVIDGDLTENIRVSSLWPTDHSDVYSVTLQVTNSMGDTASVKMPVLIRSDSSVRPQILLKEYLVYVEKDSDFDPMDYVQAVQLRGKTLDTRVEVTSEVDLTKEGSYWVWYRCDADVDGLSILTVVVE